MAHVFKVGDKGKTVNGSQYEVIAIEPRAPYPVVCLITPPSGRASVVSYRLNDTALIPPARYVYINIYPSDSPIMSGVYSTASTARASARPRATHTALPVLVPEK